MNSLGPSPLGWQIERRIYDPIVRIRDDDIVAGTDEVAQPAVNGILRQEGNDYAQQFTPRVPHGGRYSDYPALCRFAVERGAECEICPLYDFTHRAA